MKIILISIGTQGDMEPFLAIGEILLSKGHQVICAFPEQFRNLVEDSKMDFASLGTGFIEMLDSDIGKAAMGGSSSGLKKFFANIKLAKKQTSANKEHVQNQYKITEKYNPDMIVHNAKALYPIIWGLDNPGKAVLLSSTPFLHYVKNNTHVLFHSNFGPLFNKLTYSFANFGMTISILVIKKWLKIKEKITGKQLKNALLNNKVIYAISPALFPRPDYWGPNLKVLGYYESKTNMEWQTDNFLETFLKEHKKILFITFGSMLNPEPADKTKKIIDILERNRIPAIINTASGGLVKPDHFDSGLLYFVSRVPYDWIFPKIHGVIHHGGSGTTHLALKHGCASMIIPHIIDQFVWNKIIFSIGAGPKGIKINKITTKNLEPKILELMNNTSFKKRAERIASQMRTEDFREELYQSIIKM